jgi:hypothetical protein
MKRAWNGTDGRGIVQELGGRDLLGPRSPRAHVPEQGGHAGDDVHGPTAHPTRTPVAAKALLMPSTNTV